MDEEEKRSLGSLMAKYKAYKENYMKNIMFDPTEPQLSEYLYRSSHLVFVLDLVP